MTMGYTGKRNANGTLCTAHPQTAHRQPFCFVMPIFIQNSHCEAPWHACQGLWQSQPIKRVRQSLPRRNDAPLRCDDGYAFCGYSLISLLKTDSDVGYLRLCLCFVKSLFSFVWPFKTGIENEIEDFCREPWANVIADESPRQQFSTFNFQFSIDKGQCPILWKYAVSGQTQKKTVFTEICHQMVTISTYH